MQPKSVLNDKQMVQLICAYRIFNQHVDLSLSTRESATFRDNIMPLGVTTVSAASKTQPGGYAVDQEQLEQFEISDERSASDVANAIKQRGLSQFGEIGQQSILDSVSRETQKSLPVGRLCYICREIARQTLLGS